MLYRKDELFIRNDNLFMRKFKEIPTTKPWKWTQKNLDNIESVVLNDKDYGAEYRIIQKVFRKYPNNDDTLMAPFNKE